MPRLTPPTGRGPSRSRRRHRQRDRVLAVQRDAAGDGAGPRKGPPCQISTTCSPASPSGDIAKQLGVDDTIARAAVEQAVPALLTGLQQQTTDEASAQGLASALAQHLADLAEGDINLADVDTADGGKIVNKIFGSETDNVAQALSGANAAAGVDQGLVQKLLPILHRSCSAT